MLGTLQRLLVYDKPVLVEVVIFADDDRRTIRVVCLRRHSERNVIEVNDVSLAYRVLTK